MNIKNWKDVLGGLSLIFLIVKLFESFSTLGFTSGLGGEVFGANLFTVLIWAGSIWFLYRKFVKK